MGTFLWTCWTGGMEGSVLMVQVTGMLPMASNEPGKAHFKVMMSWATAVVGSVSVSLGLRGLSTGLHFVEGGQGLLGLGTGIRCLLL